MSEFFLPLRKSDYILLLSILIVGIILITLSGITVSNKETQKDRERSQLSHLFLTVSILGTVFTLL